VIERAHEVARERGLPPAQIAIAWLLHKPVVTSPIVGATRGSHIDDAIAATNVDLACDEIERLENAYRPYAVLARQPMSLRSHAPS
jgi:aryl-alcohol dehydrogenase-like predicted oxidoreductase